MIDTTSKDSIFNAIVDILESDFEFEREKLVPEAQLFQDLDLDSIDAVDLIVKLQKMTKVKVSPEDFKQIKTLCDTVEVVHKIINEQ